MDFIKYEIECPNTYYLYILEPYFGHLDTTLFMDIQDIKDDEIIGIKSTSIKFKNNQKIFCLTCYAYLIFSILIKWVIL